MGLALVAGGVRLIGREYRPLGQGLAGAGLAGLYVSAFGAHAFYGLISREAAGLLMAAITVNAVLLAMKLDARLLARLAWVGGYLTPLLLSTGEDKAVALFVYLALLDVGALVLDHRKPWPETVPLAMIGTLFLLRRLVRAVLRSGAVRGRGRRASCSFHRAVRPGHGAQGATPAPGRPGPGGRRRGLVALAAARPPRCSRLPAGLAAWRPSRGAGSGPRSRA